MSALQLISQISGQAVAADDEIRVIGDSLDRIYLINKIEIAIGRQIPNEKMAQLRTVRDLAEWIAA